MVCEVSRHFVSLLEMALKMSYWRVGGAEMHRSISDTLTKHSTAQQIRCYR
eukprot:COSAG04_NODE_434_length_14479_cov_52.278164_14_plen_51_part_00